MRSKIYSNLVYCTYWDSLLSELKKCTELWLFFCQSVRRMAQLFCWCIAMNSQAFLFGMKCVLAAGVCVALFCYFSQFYMPEILKASLVFLYELKSLRHSPCSFLMLLCLQASKHLFQPIKIISSQSFFMVFHRGC